MPPQVRRLVTILLSMPFAVVLGLWALGMVLGVLDLPLGTLLFHAPYDVERAVVGVVEILFFSSAGLPTYVPLYGGALFAARRLPWARFRLLVLALPPLHAVLTVAVGETFVRTVMRQTDAPRPLDAQALDMALLIASVGYGYVIVGFAVLWAARWLEARRLRRETGTQAS